jgi:hypothetical protein
VSIRRTAISKEAGSIYEQFRVVGSGERRQEFFPAGRHWYVNFKKRVLAVNAKFPGKTASTKPEIDTADIHISPGNTQ